MAMTDTLFEELAAGSEQKYTHTWAIALGIVAGMTAATVAIALYLRAKHPEQHIKDIDKIIEGVQDKMRMLQEMIDRQRKPLSAA